MIPDPSWSWRYQAKCNDEQYEHQASEFGVTSRTELWFPPRDKSKYTPIADFAKAVCNGKDGTAECPVRVKCLREAVDNDEQHGIFGGMSHRERNALVRKIHRKGKTVEQYFEDGCTL